MHACYTLYAARMLHWCICIHDVSMLHACCMYAARMLHACRMHVYVCLWALILRNVACMLRDVRLLQHARVVHACFYSSGWVACALGEHCVRRVMSCMSPFVVARMHVWHIWFTCVLHACCMPVACMVHAWCRHGACMLHECCMNIAVNSPTAIPSTRVFRTAYTLYLYMVITIYYSIYIATTVSPHCIFSNRYD